MVSPSYGLASDVIVARPLAIEHRRGVASSVREFPDPELLKSGASTAVAASAQHAKLSEWVTAGASGTTWPPVRFEVAPQMLHQGCSAIASCARRLC
jgi:hypothetical protein